MEDARIEGFGGFNDKYDRDDRCDRKDRDDRCDRSDRDDKCDRKETECGVRPKPPGNYEIDTLKVKKVYFSCQLRECIEDQLFDIDYPTGCNTDYRFIRCEFGEGVIEPIRHVPLFKEVDNYYAKLRATVAVPVYVVVRRKKDCELLKLPAYPIIDGCRQKDNKVRFCIDTLVFAPAEFLRQGRFFADVESLGVCEHEFCRVSGRDNLELTIGFFLIIKVISEVQLKIPTFGFADAPKPCDEVSPVSDLFCENFLDEDVTDFPEQFFPPQRHQIGGDKCPPKPCPPKKKRC